MKNLSILFLGLALIFSSCEETGPFINFEDEVIPLLDTTFITSTLPAPQLKGVLMEEFSGVKCSNCPEGNEATHDLVINFGERLVAVTAHSDFLGSPYDGNPDLRSVDANALSDQLGPINGKPATFIDRKVFPGNPTREIINPASWGGFVQDQLVFTTPVNIDLEVVSYDETSRILRYRYTLTYTEAAADHNLGIGLLESEIIAKQLDGSVKIDDYEHEFVLRDYLTPIVGSPVLETLEAGRVITKEFETELSIDWNPDHMQLIAFIRGSNDEIVHAVKIELN